MTTNAVLISGKYELLVLHRGLMEARFCDIANDPDVSGSPLLAKIHREVVSAIISAELADGLSPESWKEWLKIDENRREWSVAIQRAVGSSRWGNLAHSEKVQLVSDLLSPFEVDSRTIEVFIDSVERAKKDSF